MAKQYGVSPSRNLSNLSEAAQQYEARLEHQRNVLKHIIDVGTSLRLSMDTDTLLKRVCVAACEALRFHDAVLYLADGAGYFRACAVAHATAEEEEYLRQHPLPESIVARLIGEEYRLSDSYFIPAEAPLWQEETLNSFFVVDESVEIFSSTDPLASADSAYWQSEDLMIVPLVSGDNTLLGFLTPDGPLDGLRPTAETMSLFELFANQAAVVIEGERLSTELREALKQAQESERLKNHFLMTASHELRTPLTAIQGYLELLGEFGTMLDEATKGRFLGSARRACEELVLLLGNVMDASRIDQDRVTLAFSSVCVVQAVQLILEILEPIIARETRIVEVRIADDLHVWVDELRFRQILLNLVGNALKYTPESSGIAISAESLSWDELHQRVPAISQLIPLPTADNFAVIAIRDWGPGIRPEDQPRLFSKFVRLREAINSIQRGAGLGLYLCRQLVEAMNGHIWMESEGVNGAGCTFLVALPLCQG